jgi:PAS domain S-box-containing protein
MHSPLRVLYVDDDPGLLEIGKIFLEHTGDFSVETIDSALAAFDLLKPGQFDAIISDYQMPRMDGIDFLKKVRSTGSTIPFILFTGKGREEVVIQAINHGVDFYLQKGGAPDAQFAELAHKVRIAVERRSNEEALKKSEEKYRRIVEAASEGEKLFRTLFHEMLNGFAVHQIICDENGTPADYRFIDVNPAFEQMTGLRREGIIGKTVLELMPGTEPFWIERYGRVALTGSTDRFENYSGVIGKFFEVTVYQNAPGQFTTVISDITERKQAEESLRETGSLLSLALRSARAGTWYWDIPKGKLEWSPEFYTLFGLPPDTEASFETWLATLHPDDRTPAMEKVDQSVKEHRDLRNEYRILLPDGSWRWIGASGSTSYNKEGNPVRMSGVCIDITEFKQSEAALLDSRHQLHAMAANIPGVVFRFYVNPDGTTGFDYISERSLQVLGLENDTATFEGRFIAGLSPEDRERYHSTVLEAIKSRSLWEFETWYVKPSGKRIWLSGISSPVMEEDRLLFDGVAFDNTGRKRIEEELLRKNEELNASYEQISAAEEELHSNYDELSRQEQALRESEVRFRSLIQNSTDIIRILNADGHIVYDSTSSTRILGYPPGFTIGKNPLDFIHPDDQKRVREALGEVFDGINPGIPTEFRIRKADGSYIFVEALASNLIGTPGVDGIVTTTRPIDERKKSETALITSEERFRGITERISDLVIIADPEGKPTYVSPSVQSILGFPPEYYIGVSANNQIFPPEDVMKIGVAMERLMRGSPEEQVEFRMKKKDGTFAVFEGRGTPVFHEGVYAGVQVVARDITDRKLAEAALQHLTEFQQGVITNARVWLSVLDHSGRILMWNIAAEEISGYRSTEVLGQKEVWKKIYPDKEYRKQITDTITRIIKEDNYLENFETTILSKQGTKKVISWNTRGIPDETGSVSDYIAIGLDVTDRNRAEEALRESEQRMKDIISFLPDATLVIDKNGVVLAWNRAMEVMTGVPADQMIGKANYEYALPFYHERRPITVDLVLHDDPEVVAKYPVMEKEGMSIRSEIYLPHLNQGRGAYLWFKASPLYDPAGNVMGAIESIRDITERRQVEEALITSRGQLAEAMDLAHMANWEYDVATGIFTFDDRFYDLYGTTAELEGGHQMPVDVYAKKFVHPDDQHLVAEEVKKAIHATDPGYLSQVEHRIIRRGGEVRNIVVRFGITKDENGRTIRTHGANQDITERKQAEEAISQVNRKLNLLSGITRHDINNQLILLNGFLELLRKKAPDPALDEFFTRIRKASSRITAMIQFTKEYEKIGINSPIWQDCRSIVEIAANEAPLGKITINNDFPAGIEIFADPLIVKVFYNLMDNAIRYGGKIRSIRFFSEVCNEEYVMVCEDDGDGIPADKKERIFERGYGKNTGLGLALSREALDITGITIKETGGPGNGARFELTVPKGMYRVTGSGEKLPEK